MARKDAAKTSERRKNFRAKARVEAPLNPEQILRRENAVPSVAMPAEIADPSPRAGF